MVVRLKLAPARGWATLVLLVHLLAAFAALAGLPAAAAAIVVSGLTLSGWYGACTALLRHPAAVREVGLRIDGSAEYLDGSGTWREAAGADAAILGHRFAALRLGRGRQRRSVVLVPGAVEPDAFRRARVWARWGTPAA